MFGHWSLPEFIFHKSENAFRLGLQVATSSIDKEERQCYRREREREATKERERMNDTERRKEREEEGSLFHLARLAETSVSTQPLVMRREAGMRRAQPRNHWGR